MSLLGRFNLNSLATQLVVFVFGSIFLTAVVLSSIAIGASHLHMAEVMQLLLERHLETRATRTDVWIEGQRLALREYAQLPSSDLSAEMGSLPTPDPAWQSLWLVNSNGDVENEILGSLPGTRMPSLDQPNDLVLVEYPDGSPTLLLSEPVDSSRKSSHGYLVAEVSLDALEGIVTEAGPFKPVLTNLYLLDGQVVILSESSLEVPGIQGEIKPIDWARAGAPLSDTANPHGQRVLGASIRVASTPLILTAEIPFKIASRMTQDLISRIALGVLGLAIAFCLLAYLGSKRIMGPIERLTDGARRISQGEDIEAIRDPGGQDEIGLLTRIFNEMMERTRKNRLEVEIANDQLRVRNEELQTANEILNQLSITDGLTRLHNHRYFQDQLDREIHLHGRTHSPLSMLLIDLDDFKALNDRYGHIVGDEALVRVAEIMNNSVRASDLLARYGGEEFVVLASNTELAGAVSLAEKIRMAIEAGTDIVDSEGAPIEGITVSIGVAEYSEGRRLFFESADRALYRAKAEGKNCVVSSDDARLV